MSDYVAATYTNYLDAMLARGAVGGQGRHPEATSREVAKALARLDPYPFIAAEVADTFGMEEADALLRRAIRRQARYRGNDIRREVEGRGLPLDAAHLTVYWDTPRRYSEEDAPRDVRDYDAHYVAYEIMGCGFHDQMSRLCPQRLAILMCEEDHIAMAKEFNPAIEVWYPALLTRGEAKCIFRFSMSQEAAEVAARQATRVSEAARRAGKSLAGERFIEVTPPAEAYRQLARVIVIFYHYLADELLRTVGSEQTEEIVRRAMRAMGAWRGEMMRQDHQKRGWDLTLENLITHFDDPSAGDAWIADNMTLTSTRHAKDITASAFSSMFDTLGTGPLAAAYFEEALTAQARAYNPDISVTIPQLMERGDPVSRYYYEMSSA